jgi:hypothetical protein
MRVGIEVDDRGLHQLHGSFQSQTRRIFKDPEPMVILFWKRKFKPKRVGRGSLIWKIFKSLESTRGYNKVCVIHNDLAINLI